MSAEHPLPVADLLGNDGPLPEVHFKGTVYPVGLPCPEVIATAERAVPALAIANLKATQEFADPNEYALDERAIKSAIRGREYGFGRPLFNEVLGGPDGNRLILWACLKLKTPTVTLEDVRAMLRDESAAAGLEAALEVVAPAFFSQGAEGMDAPPGDRAAIAANLSARVAADLAVTKLRRLALTTDSDSSPTP